MTPRRWSLLAAALLITQGAIHLQQYRLGFSAVPTIGRLFAVNVAVSVLLAIAVLVRPNRWTALAGIAFSLGSLGALVLSQTTGLFGFMQTALGQPEVITIAAEVGATAALAGMIAALARRSDDGAVAVAVPRRHSSGV